MQLIVRIRNKPDYELAHNHYELAYNHYELAYTTLVTIGEDRI